MNINVKRIGLILLIFLWATMSWAQEMAVAVNTQFTLFSKILAFDRNLKTRRHDEIVIGIVYQSRFRTSLNVKNEILRIAGEYSTRKIEGIPIRYIPIDLGDETDLESAISTNSVNVLYIAPLRVLEIAGITRISRAKRIITLTGVPDYVESGLAIGIGTKGEKPQILINLAAAKAEGANLSSELLKLSKVIK